ncbi:MAG: guanylate kinase [bacterium]
MAGEKDTRMRGKLIVVSAPSGAGKTTIVKAVLNNNPGMLFSISATTRAQRGNEVHGKDYFFLSRKDFETRIQENGLVEWEEIYGNLYGTLRTEIEKALSSGATMLFDIDVKGGLSIKRQYPHDAVLIFIHPPSFEILRDRLINRKTEDEATILRRLDRVPMEMEFGNEFDYQVVNDNLEKAVKQVQAIVHANTERLLLQS